MEEPARSRPLKDQFESNLGVMQVEEANAVKHEEAYLRDQRFEFAASQYIFLHLYICCVVF